MDELFAFLGFCTVAAIIVAFLTDWKTGRWKFDKQKPIEPRELDVPSLILRKKLIQDKRNAKFKEDMRLATQKEWFEMVKNLDHDPEYVHYTENLYIISMAESKGLVVIDSPTRFGKIIAVPTR